MIGHPLDTVKVRLQLNPAYKGAWDCLLQTIKREGILGLYKGMASPLAGISIVNAVLFSAYGWMKNVQSSNGGQLLSIREIAVAGAFAGIVNSFVLSPVELFKIRLQAEHSSSSVRILKGPMDVARQLIHQHGWANGVFRGTLATIYREIP